MKFNEFLCQLIKISTLFTESLEKGLDKVVSRGEKNFSVHRKYMNFLRPRKTALDEPLYKLSAGRSMVEMLGVLAIIGVLSVGAMSGYSKAMMKYKLNKQIEQINLIFNNMLEHLHTPNAFTCNAAFECANTSIFWKLNAFPTTMQGVTSSGRPDTNSIYDVLHTKYYIYSTSKPSLGVRITIDNTQNGRDSCLNILQTAKEFYQDILHLQFRRGTSEGEKWEWLISGGKSNYYSEKLNKLDITKMHERCEVCDSQSTTCYMNIAFGK